MIRSLTLSIGALALALLALVGASGTASAQQSIAVGDIFFCDASFENGVCTTTVTEGDTVTWSFGGELAHTTTACGADCDSATGSPLWDSGVLNPGASFVFTFADAGTYLYRCDVHPTQMRGQIIVEPAAQPEPTDAPVDGVAPPTATAGPGVTGAPVTGAGPGAGASSAWWLLIVASAGAGLALAGAAFRLARR